MGKDFTMGGLALGWMWFAANLLLPKELIAKSGRTPISVKPLFIATTETWVNNGISNTEVDINGYCIERHDRNSRGGGVAIYIYKRRVKIRANTGTRGATLWNTMHRIQNKQESTLPTNILVSVDIDSSVLVLMRNRDQARKKALKTKSIEDFNIYKRLRNCVTSRLRKAKSDFSNAN
jgi:hypothetical protein